MFDIILSIDYQNGAIAKEFLTAEDMYTMLTSDLEKLLLAAQPRLARLAHAHGVAPDGVEDVVQETLVNAWQNLAYLRAPDRFEAWLNGICRNISMRWIQAQGKIERHQRTFSSLYPTQEGDNESSVVLDIPDPQAFDLTEELNHQDLAVLLDRAMGHLPATARKALELYYIAGIPQREVALQLGMTINALEVKLHRARRQLRQVLNNELRADAASFGLALDNETADQGWQETSLWCFICGRQRLQGIFEPQPESEIGLRLQCPTCSAHTGFDVLSTGNMVSFADRRSFRPAFKYALQALPHFYAQALTSGYQRCPICKQIAPLRGIEPGTLPAPFYKRFVIILECPTCGEFIATIFSLCLTYPAFYQFTQQHQRCIIEPEELIEYEGQAALRASIIDIMSAARLTLILHRHTLQLLAVFQK